MFKRTRTLWIYTALLLAIVFILGMVCGWILPAETKLQVLQPVLTKFQNIIDQSTSDSWLAIHIFRNNLVAAVLIFVSAIIPALPFLIIFGNGVIIGIFGDIIMRVNELQPNTFWNSVIGLIPHGVFELSAIFLAGSLGLVAFLKLVATKLVSPELNRRQFLLLTLKWFGGIVIPLLFIAGFVEVFISGQLADRLIQPTAIGQDSRYAVTLNNRALAEQNCVPSTPSQMVNLTDDLLSGLYDPEVMSLLKQESTIPHWQITYTCPHDAWFVVTSFPAEQWKPDQAQHFIQTILTHRQANFTQDGSTIRTKLDGTELSYTITELSGRTIVITQYNMSGPATLQLDISSILAENPQNLDAE